MPNFDYKCESSSISSSASSSIADCILFDGGGNARSSAEEEGAKEEYKVTGTCNSSYLEDNDEVEEIGSTHEDCEACLTSRR